MRLASVPWIRVAVVLLAIALATVAILWGLAGLIESNDWNRTPSEYRSEN